MCIDAETNHNSFTETSTNVFRFCYPIFPQQDGLRMLINLLKKNVNLKSDMVLRSTIALSTIRKIFARRMKLC